MRSAIGLLQEKYEVARAILHGFSWEKWKTGSAREKLGLIPAGQEHVLGQEDGKKRLVQVVAELSSISPSEDRFIRSVVVVQDRCRIATVLAKSREVAGDWHQ